MNDAIRIPPQSEDAEQAVLGAIMLRQDCFPEVASILKSDEAFYRRDHRLIWRAMRECFKKDLPLDAVTLGEWFESNGLGEQIGGTGTLIELASNTPSAANVKAYAEIVHQKHQLRRLIEAGTEVVSMGFRPDGATSEDVIGRAATLIGEIVQVRESAEATAEQALKAMYGGIMRRFESDSDLAGIASPFPALDDLTGGFQDGRVYGVGSRPKMGKSVLTKDFAEHAAVVCGKHVGIWTMEMSRDEYMQRIVCSQGSLESGALKHPKLMTEFQWSTLTETIGRLKYAPITIYDQADLSIEMFEAQARVLKAKGKLNMAVLDYLGLMHMPDDGDNLTQKIQLVTRRLKVVAMKLNIPVIVVFQLNRGNETGAVRPPRASDARDSGAIEQDLDCMMMLHRPSYYDDAAPKGMRLEVVLQRDGPTGIVRLEDDLKRFRFLPSDEPWVDQKEAPSRGSGRGKGKEHVGF